MKQQATISRLLANFSYGGTGGSFMLLAYPVSLERSFHFSFRTLQHSGKRDASKVRIENSQPIIEAIGRFEAEENVFPSALTALVPKFASNIPNTGIATYPNYEYIRNQNPSLYGGNSWIMAVPVSTDKLSYDLLLYFPNQKYPKDELGRNVRKFGDWVLVEEGSVAAKEDGFIFSNEKSGGH
ncbi:MAG TPA: hypothetical protein VH280_09670 [Verrucomicrobiae bacterium]|jgi:hypothetical protein|nr:hypothetical protein [Verrucomicrobiae bacterium]